MAVGTVNHFHVVDATGRRKFTIAELKSICAFPDDFILTGTYAQQWERLRNSDPPLMMKAITETVRDKVLARCGSNSGQSSRSFRTRETPEQPPRR
jgi:DNA (cytosine-5)-methyltransferase 1